jgi:hypothetical protein
MGHNSSIRVDKGMLPPPMHHAPPGKSQYAFAQLEVGDSFLAPSGKSMSAIRTAASLTSRKLGRKFIVRKTPEGICVWRVK